MTQPSGDGTAPRSKLAVLIGVALGAFGLDALSKALVVANLTPGEPVHVIGSVLEFDLLRNSGAAFSFGTGYTVVFTLLAIVVIGVVVRFAPRLRSTWYAVAFGLLLAGASGNLADRIFRAPGLFRGDVVDWIEVTRYYPVFNLADSSICIAAVLFVLASLRGIRMDGSHGDRPPARDAGASDADASDVPPAPGGTEAPEQASTTSAEQASATSATPATEATQGQGTAASAEAER
ncbi:MAG TPA: signal peptidase II [Trebonia sp.]|nr:signal peptidase II [Trebonia sp.]